MSWADNYQPGSFRGVPFATQRSDRSGGLRGPTHEFPGRDKPLFEDLGNRAETFAIEAYVWGEDYDAKRDALVAALRGRGAGTLVHPYYGTMVVAATDWSVGESTDDQGIAFFSITFGESGLAPPAPAPDTVVQAQDAADAAAQEAPQIFASAFDIADAQSFVEGAAADLVKYGAAAVAIAGGLQGGIGPTLLAFQSHLDLLPGNLPSLLRQPLALGQSVLGLVQTVRTLGGGSLSLIAALSGLLGFGADLPPVIGSTSARERQRANQEAFVDLLTTTAASELVRAIAGTDFASYEAAGAVRDKAVALLEARIVHAADARRDDVARTFERLQAAIVLDVTARGGSLARVYRFIPAVTEPALVIAARLYGIDAALPARAADIAARNRLSHPGFVSGGTPIEVLEVAGG
ncbi:MAG: hypothetical protein EOP62_14390 [Sphingomonadales bacterium]|nr:MAG: hypothetical protein EOP62_14390 [Sphingomonadales bacterium]